jgi:hypothetical protein
VPISPGNKPAILVVHGVQLGEDSVLNQDESIRGLVLSRLNGTHSKFDVDFYKYENISDGSLNKFKKLSKLIISSPIGKAIAPPVIDIVGGCCYFIVQQFDGQKNSSRTKR